MRFGGRRLWFRCPLCGRRCRVLYVGRRMGCQVCLRLRYSSQAETRAARSTRAMFKIVRRLHPEAQFNDLPRKPKGMHWSTYNQLADRYEAFSGAWNAEALRRFAGRHWL
jgi:hypothetical protein